ncbi:tetratricopeptide repeat protein, partial [Vibrio natriegens]
MADTTSQKKPEEAFLWRLRAALLGDNKACIKMAYCYQAGIAVAKNRLRAVYWLERAAEQGDTEAQYLVAKMLGEGGENDKAVAYIWLSLAYAGGNRDAKVLRDNVVQYIGVDAIVGVQNVANTI